MLRKFWGGMLVCACVGVGVALARHHNSGTAKRLSGVNAVDYRPFIRQLHSGDLVFRTGNDVTSFMICRLNARDRRFSHVGVVCMENGYPFVYHCIGGEDNPEQSMCRDSFQKFVSPAHNNGFALAQWRQPPAVKEKFVARVRHFYEQQTAYDMDFDLATDNKLYCTEMVAKAMEYALCNPGAIHVSTRSGMQLIIPEDIAGAKGVTVGPYIRY